tara:strand:- start:125 stop:694 length:570 start_codon:yes stop_codon:yes gene_type:complete
MERTFELLTKKVATEKEVNATFKLSQNSLDAISWLKQKGGLSNKRLFNSIWENQNEKFMKIIRDVPFDPKIKRVKRSQRMSRKSLNNLNELVNKYGLKRDQIVELTFLAYKILYEKMLEENIEKHKKALEIVDDLWSFAEKIEKKSETILDEDDPILERLGKIIVVINNLSDAIQNEIENDVIIDPEDF